MKYKTVKDIKRRGYPTSSSKYKEAHSEADSAEKKNFPVGYEKLKSMDKKINKSELIGTHSPFGKIKVSNKVPKKLRKEVAFHEEIERKADNRLKKRAKK